MELGDIFISYNDFQKVKSENYILTDIIEDSPIENDNCIKTTKNKYGYNVILLRNSSNSLKLNGVYTESFELAITDLNLNYLTIACITFENLHDQIISKIQFHYKSRNLFENLNFNLKIFVIWNHKERKINLLIKFKFQVEENNRKDLDLMFSDEVYIKHLSEKIIDYINEEPGIRQEIIEMRKSIQWVKQS